MLDAIYWTAAALAFAGAWRSHGRRLPRPVNMTAWALLASAAFCLAARWQGWPFRRDLWLAVDVATIAAIAWPLVPIFRARAWRWLFVAYRREVIVLALFVPGIAAYALAPDARHVVSTLAATAQLLVTVPYQRLARRWLHALRNHRDWASFDLRVAAA